jgi:predicted ATPase
MSDGTLRAFGVLISLFQAGTANRRLDRLIGIEEPETALHPAAAGVLFDCLTEAAERTQVLVTSHSPDLLHHKGLDVDSILAVVSEDGETRIAPVDEETREVLRRRLATAGELLRTGRLQPVQARLKALKRRPLKLFEELPE